jgi:putative ABC transport system substrate-binding protein
MRRREFISVIAGAAVWPLGARANQPAMPVIGFLNPASGAEAIPNLVAAFRRGLVEAGYVEGKNLAIEYRFTNFRPELMTSRQLRSRLPRSGTQRPAFLSLR